MLTRHCDAPDCDTWGNSLDWLDVYDGDGELVATLCCRWCLAKWGSASGSPATRVRSRAGRAWRWCTHDRRPALQRVSFCRVRVPVSERGEAMTELERFRDHAAEMATSEHKPECRGHLPTRWGWAREIHPDPSCAGCITKADRALWLRLAAEIDDYLTDDDAPLWEDA